MNKLRECPFCGGEGDYNNNGVQDKDGNPIWWVECLNCGSNLEGDDNTKESATEAWQRRHNPNPEALTVKEANDRRTAERLLIPKPILQQ